MDNTPCCPAIYKDFRCTFPGCDAVLCRDHAKTLTGYGYLCPSHHAERSAADKRHE